jgi:tRNA modification GTPase
MAGGVGRDLERLRQQLLDLVADVEAGIDFADEATPDAVPVAAVWDDLEARVAAVAAGLTEAMRRLAGRDAAATDLPRVVLVGRPNIGKSSLFNALVGTAAALVADETGTTRDWIAARLDDAASGAACLLVDIAGLAKHELADDGSPAAEADRRARAEIDRAAVIIACRDARDESDRELPALAGSVSDASRIEVVLRCDLVPDARVADGVINTSSQKGTGLPQLREAIFAHVAESIRDRSPATLRMRVGVAEAQRAVAAAEEAIAAARTATAMADEAVVAGMLHEAIDALGEVTGTVIGTDLLDRIFSRHCVGK